ncbi:unnamed protein product, partial [Owenia fusiformis]
MAVFIEEGKRFEELLATDNLFVEYFNSFLALPTFPDALLFNKETKGFEVANDARKRISKEIKTAIRESKRKSRIYRVSKHHSFSDITLIPMEDEPWQESREIETSFTVMTLNKEQGIEWIKKERLPMFLESEYYLEYRLATILSQVKLKQEQNTGDYNVIKIDFTPITNDEKSAEEIAREEDERLTNQIMKECFVCMGDTPNTTTDAWMSQAKSTVKAELSTTPSTTGGIISAKHSSVARPKSTSSLFDRQLQSTTESGYESANIDLTSITSDIEAMDSKLFEGESLKPITPRPSETVCVINSASNENLSKPLSTGVAYATNGKQEDEPRPEDQVTAVISDDTSVDADDVHRRSVGFAVEDDIKSDSAESEMSIPYTGSDRSSALDEDLYTFRTISDLGAVIVGTVLKQSIAEITEADIHDVSFNDSVKQTFPHKRYHSYTVDMLAGAECYVLQDPTTPVPTPTPPPSDDEDDKHLSDDDSLLDSEDDFEEMDNFFRRKKKRRFTLDSKKGVDEFGKFLEGTRGERNWSFWLDVDRCRNITDAGQLQQYLTAMKEMYLRHGAPLELTQEVKVALGLTEPSSWTVEKLLKVQNNMAEPLVLYWGPRFLLNQKCKVKPEKNELYKHQKLISGKDKPRGSSVYPNPPTATMLPLRPKTCMPRVMRSAPEKSLEITDAFEPTSEISVYYNNPNEITKTSIPPIGVKKRIYNFSAYPKQAVHNITKLKNMEKHEPTPLIKQKLPKELITPKLDVSLKARPGSARSSTDDSKLMSKKPRAHSAISRASSAISSNTVPVPPKEPGPNRPVSGRSSRPTSRLSAKSLADTHDDLSSMTSAAHPTSLAELEDGIEKSKRDKRGSASTIQSEISEFFGGRRLEGLLQALSSEKLAGNFIKKYIENTGNKLWLNCMNFWTELQEYHKLFYADTIDPFTLKKKAQHIHAQYIVRPSPYNIGCGKEISDATTAQLDPPYEELFDLAEEYCFNTLFEAWSQMLTCDLTTYEKIELIEVKRHLETKNKYVTSLQRRGLIKRSVTPEEPMEGYEDPVYDEALLEKIPEEFREFNLEKLVHNRIELEHYRVFLTENYASMDLMCWMDVEAFRRIPHTDERRRNMKAKDIRVKYMTKKYFFGPNSPAGREGQEKVMEAGGGWGKLLEDRPPTQCLLEMQKYVRERLEKKWLPMFLATDGFAERMHERATMSDAAEDILLQRRKRSQAVWKMMESKWITSSKDIITFRKALMNPITSLQFRRFASIKGDTLENNVLFWQEVQKYKEMYHTHSDEHLVNQKVVAIIS